MSVRKDNHPVRDASLLPTIEADLAPITVGVGNPVTLDLTAAAAYRAGTVPEGNPLMLLLYCGVEFVEGQVRPVVATNLPRSASAVHTICVNGRTTWYLDAASGGTVRGKVLLAL